MSGYAPLCGSPSTRTSRDGCSRPPYSRTTRASWNLCLRAKGECANSSPLGGPLSAPIRRTEPEAERRTDPAPPRGHGHPLVACSPLTRGRVALRGDALRPQFALAAARHRSSTEIGCGAGQEAIADIAGDAVRTNLNADADQAGQWSGALSIGSAAPDSLRDGLATRRDRADSASTPPRRLVESPPASGPTPARNTRDIEVERGT